MTAKSLPVYVNLRFFLKWTRFLAFARKVTDLFELQSVPLHLFRRLIPL